MGGIPTKPCDQIFLDSAGVARKIVKFRRSEKIYAQGDPTKGVKYIQEGGVKLSVVNEVGKEAVVAMLGPGDFFGEGCMAGQPVCMGTATAIVSSEKRLARTLLLLAVTVRKTSPTEYSPKYRKKSWRR